MSHFRVTVQLLFNLCRVMYMYLIKIWPKAEKFEACMELVPSVGRVREGSSMGLPLTTPHRRATQYNNGGAITKHAGNV